MVQLQQETIVNRHELRVIGMSRSGNHAILQWLVAQMAADVRGGRVCWVNCPEPRWNPYWTARPFDDGEAVWTSYSGFNLEAEKGRFFSEKDWLLFNYEDTFLRVACSEEYEREHDAWVGRSTMRRDVLILRDPFNLFASRRHSLRHAVDERAALRIWKQHAKQFVAARPPMLRHDPVLILYNRWCDDHDYRRGICEALDVPFTDADKERVPAVHGGSSFDGLAYDGRASAMRTADRWRKYADDPTFRALFDAEVINLSRQIFGTLPMIETLTRAPAPEPATRTPEPRPRRRPLASAS